MPAQTHLFALHIYCAQSIDLHRQRRPAPTSGQGCGQLDLRRTAVAERVCDHDGDDVQAVFGFGLAIDPEPAVPSAGLDRLVSLHEDCVRRDCAADRPEHHGRSAPTRIAGCAECVE